MMLAGNDLNLAPATIPGLQLNGLRMTLARYPNSNPETDVFPTGWVTNNAGAKWLQPKAVGPAQYETTATPTYRPLLNKV